MHEPRVAGIRVHGKHNAFVNNYLYGIYKPIECCWGETDPPHRENLTGHGSVTKLAFAYRASHDNLIAHNTFVKCDTVFQWTKKNIPIKHIREKMGMVERNGPFLAALWKKETFQYRLGETAEPTFPARRWYVLNNVVLDTPQLVRINLARGPPPAREEEFRWEGNLTYCKSGVFEFGADRTFENGQFRYHDPQMLSEDAGVVRPGPNSLCRGKADVSMRAVRPYVDRPGIDAVLAAATDLGAAGC